MFDRKIRYASNKGEKLGRIKERKEKGQKVVSEVVEDREANLLQ